MRLSTFFGPLGALLRRAAGLRVAALGVGLAALAVGWVLAASPTINETVAIVDATNPTKQAGVDGAGNLQVNCVTGCSAGSGTGANNADGVAAVSTGLGSSVGYGFVWNGATWDRQPGSATNGTSANVTKIGGASLALGQTTMAASLPVAIASNQSTLSANTAQINGVTVLTGTGAQGTGSQRVTVATDSATVAGSASLPAGTNLIGKAGIDQTTPGTTNGVVMAAATAGGASVSSTQVANNTTAIVVKGSAGTLYGIEVFNNSATIAYVKFYNAASATCGSGTPVQRVMIPANASGAGAISQTTLGIAYGTGITMCITTGFADTDATAPAASTYIVNAIFK